MIIKNKKVRLKPFERLVQEGWRYDTYLGNRKGCVCRYGNSLTTSMVEMFDGMEEAQRSWLKLMVDSSPGGWVAIPITGKSWHAELFCGVDKRIDLGASNAD